MGLEFKIPIADFLSLCKELIQQSDLGNAYLRPVVYNAGPDLGVYAPCNNVNFGLLLWEWPSIFADGASENGLALTTDVPYRRPPSNAFPVQAKSSAAYLIGSINRNIAERSGFNDALMMTHDGFIAEATGANIFIVKNNTILTPPPNTFLNELTRQTVISLLAPDHPVIERSLSHAEVLDADEIFLTGTAYEVMPVRCIDDHCYQIGEHTHNVRRRYIELTHSHLKSEVLQDDPSSIHDR